MAFTLGKADRLKHTEGCCHHSAMLNDALHLGAASRRPRHGKVSRGSKNDAQRPSRCSLREHQERLRSVSHQSAGRPECSCHMLERLNHRLGLRQEERLAQRTVK